MNSKVYKCCAVPQCNNTSIKTPRKLFVYVPHKKTIRKTWLNLARRDPLSIKISSIIYFCEDHFDLPNDMDNYMEYHVMGSVSQVRMKPGCIPSKFKCQSNRRKQKFNITEQTYVHKKQRKLLSDEYKIYLEERSNYSEKLEFGETSSGSSGLYASIENINQDEKNSKAIKTEIQLVNQMTSPLRPNFQTVTSTLKINNGISTSHIPPNEILTIEDQSDSDNSYTSLSIAHKESPLSTVVPMVLSRLLAKIRYF
ncbi:uncharacterized protein LOC120628610 [Pararge aegeria]|uniref:Jg15066 protein n=2 Tax=Pararge aegeria TaxID=116150 RepID=A0A8S4SJA2_9NEOP|nr:uncharacterized protein LOC120628610 [Pararge aegeria]CAH2269290.1 jg15066 [Pararge aegeria aegeria]